MKALVRPVKLDPSVVLITVTACVEGGAAPCATATVGFHPAIVPSIVEKRNKLGLPGASRNLFGCCWRWCRWVYLAPRFWPTSEWPTEPLPKQRNEGAPEVYLRSAEEA